MWWVFGLGKILIFKLFFLFFLIETGLFNYFLLFTIYGRKLLRLLRLHAWFFLLFKYCQNRVIEGISHYARWENVYFGAWRFLGFYGFYFLVQRCYWSQCFLRNHNVFWKCFHFLNLFLLINVQRRSYIYKYDLFLHFVITHTFLLFFLCFQHIYFVSYCSLTIKTILDTWMMFGFTLNRKVQLDFTSICIVTFWTQLKDKKTFFVNFISFSFSLGDLCLY